ncbi:unnamed protein product [Miscanthus lutarioriparius]|uniref:Uncharacterized protein n=1 Tax=Miscanthus lutarioriparius TaxID=422564 RepID=A0A811S8F1_9POAL|nr:unnamed protein product [Miscanthus lutarioriparius]
MTHQDPCMDKRRMGKGLDRISRGLNNKIKVHIAQGNKRPEAPMEAAKLASEAGIFLWDHIRIFTRWKDYEDDAVKELLDDYMGKIGWYCHGMGLNYEQPVYSDYFKYVQESYVSLQDAVDQSRKGWCTSSTVADAAGNNPVSRCMLVYRFIAFSLAKNAVKLS